MITTIEKSRKNRELLVIKNADKIALAKVTKVLNAIDLNNTYSWAISNTDIDANENLRLIGIKKYYKCVGQIQDKQDELSKNWISILRVFVKHS